MERQKKTKNKTWDQVAKEKKMYLSRRNENDVGHATLSSNLHNENWATVAAVSSGMINLLYL